MVGRVKALGSHGQAGAEGPVLEGDGERVGHRREDWWECGEGRCLVAFFVGLGGVTRLL